MKIRFYGMLRDYAGTGEHSLVPRDRGSLSEAELLDLLAEELPGLREVKRLVEKGEINLILVVDGRPLKRGETIPVDAQVDILPPASGG